MKKGKGKTCFEFIWNHSVESHYEFFEKYSVYPKFMSERSIRKLLLSTESQKIAMLFKERTRILKYENKIVEDANEKWRERNIMQWDEYIKIVRMSFKRTETDMKNLKLKVKNVIACPRERDIIINIL